MEILEISPDCNIEFFEYQPCYTSGKAHFTIGFRRVLDWKLLHASNLNIGHAVICIDPTTVYKFGTKPEPTSVLPPDPETDTENLETLPEVSKTRVEFTCGNRREYLQSDIAKHLRRSDAVQRQLESKQQVELTPSAQPTAPQEARHLTDQLSTLNISDIEESIGPEYM